MFIRLCICTAGVLLASTSLSAQTRLPDDAVVATVNGEKISYRQLIDRLVDYHGQGGLEAMINRMIVKQAADKEKIAVSDVELQVRIDEVKKLLGGPKNYVQWLGNSGLTEAQHRDQVHYTMLEEKLVQKQMPVSDAELERLQVRIIACSTPKKAQDVETRLRARADFAQVALQESDDPKTRTAGGGGLVPPFHRLQMPTTWVHANKLQVGQYTREPIPAAAGGALFIKLEARLPASTLKPQERAELTKALQVVRLDQWLERARKAAAITRPTPLKPAAAASGG